jgi:hypothetical protein
MRRRTELLLTFGLLAAALPAVAQGPGRLREGPPESADDFVGRMMAFDKDKDGKLTRAELTETRLHRLFDRADTDKDGVVTKQELTALATREMANDRGGRPGFGPPGFGPPGGGGGPGGPMMAPPRPGEILPAMLRQRLRLTEEQAKQLDALQSDVDRRLSGILTDEQKQTLRDLRDRFGRPGGPGGPPPGGPRGFPPDRPPPGDGPGRP